nr:MAG TPA: hypothetical protein [Caudoviricetes sp.]
MSSFSAIKFLISSADTSGDVKSHPSPNTCADKYAEFLLFTI